MIKVIWEEVETGIIVIDCWQEQDISDLYFLERIGEIIILSESKI